MEFSSEKVGGPNQFFWWNFHLGRWGQRPFFLVEFSSGQVGAGTTVHERLIEVMREKKQGPGALASPSGRVRSLEDFLAACIWMRFVFGFCF